jgi:hypothetical protein
MEFGLYHSEGFFNLILGWSEELFHPMMANVQTPL